MESDEYLLAQETLPTTFIDSSEGEEATLDHRQKEEEIDIAAEEGSEQEMQQVPESNYKVYLIESGDRKRTYVGLTKDFKKRLRQHNGEIKGGARYTRKGTNWKPRCIISGFGTDTQARMLEWRLHHPLRRCYHSSPLLRRVVDLHAAMLMQRWTKNCDEVRSIKNLKVSFSNIELTSLGFITDMRWPQNVVVTHNEKE